jgi:eight transmembrane protein EpsH (proposed exosortase)
MIESVASSTTRGAWLGTIAAVVTAFVLCYWTVITKLLHDWAHDDNYSHGFLIVPLALYFVWERRARLAAASYRPNWFGLVVVVASLGMLIAGTLGAELFVSRVSIVFLIAGTVLFAAGFDALRVLAFPIAFLFLMVPPPAIIFNQIAFPLQLLASQFGEATLQALSIPVLREGNLITLANTTLEVAEACSGIRSLISLLTLGIVYGYFVDPRISIRTIIALSAVPIAIVANGLRVAGTGVAAHYYGVEAAEGFFHTFSGWIVFVVAFALMYLAATMIIKIAPSRVDATPAGTPSLTSEIVR